MMHWLSGSLMSIKKRIESAYSFTRIVYEDFIRDNGSLMAAAVSFYTFLALVPLALIAVAIVGYVLGSPERAQEIVLQYLREAGVSDGSQVTDVVREVVLGRGIAAAVSLAILLWSGTTAVANLTKAVNIVWDVQETRGFIQTRFLAAGVLLLLGILLGISFAITVFMSWIRGLDREVFGIRPGELPFIWEFLGYLLPVLVSITTFTIFYRVMPNIRVKLKVALTGGVFAGLLWELAKVAFNYYVGNIADYSRIYGSLGGIILLLVWIYYSAIVTILGAEVASVWQGMHNPNESMTS